MLSKKQLALLSIGTSLTFWDIFNVPYIENYASVNLGEISSTLILSAEMIGYFVGGLFNGYIAMKFGRKKGLILSMLLISLGSLLGLLSINYLQLVLAEFIIGIGIEGEIAVLPAYVAEMSPYTSRGRAIGFTTMSGFLMSLVVGPIAVILGEKFWRLLFIPSLLLASISAVYRTRLSESKMWIEKKGERFKWDNTVVLFIIIWFMSYFTGYSLFATPIFEFLSSHGFSNNSVAFTYILYGDPIGVVVASLLNDNIERKYSSSMPNLLTAILMIVWPFVPSVAFLPVGFAIMFLQGFKFPTMYSYTAENLSTKIRTLGYGIADGIGHLGGALGPIVYAFSAGYFGVNYATMLVGSVSIISAIIILIYGLITTGLPLEKLKG
jgi:MFS family permease